MHLVNAPYSNPTHLFVPLVALLSRFTHLGITHQLPSLLCRGAPHLKSHLCSPRRSVLPLLASTLYSLPSASFPPHSRGQLPLCLGPSGSCPMPTHTRIRTARPPSKPLRRCRGWPLDAVARRAGDGQARHGCTLPTRRTPHRRSCQGTVPQAIPLASTGYGWASSNTRKSHTALTLQHHGTSPKQGATPLTLSSVAWSVGCQHRMGVPGSTAGQVEEQGPGIRQRAFAD